MVLGCSVILGIIARQDVYFTRRREGAETGGAETRDAAAPGQQEGGPSGEGPPCCCPDALSPLAIRIGTMVAEGDDS